MAELLALAACTGNPGSAAYESLQNAGDAAKADDVVDIGKGVTSLPAGATVLAAAWTEQILVDGTHLYFVDGTHLLKLSLAGGAAVELVTTSCCPVAALALGPTDVFFVEAGVQDSTGSHGFVRTVPKMGGPVTTLADEQSFPAHLTIDGDTLYWSTRRPDGTGAIDAMSVTGGTVREVAVARRTSALTAGGGFVYWGDWGSEPTSVLRVPIDGGSPEVLGSFKTKPVSLAVTSDAVYVALASTGSVDVTFDDGQIAQVPLNGGPIEFMATAQRNPRTLAIDATLVYWTTWGTLRASGVDERNGGLSRAPLASGAVERMADLDAASALALDATSLYWSQTCPDLECRVIAKMHR